MVVPGSAPVIQQDHALEPDLGRGSTENSAVGPETERGTDQVLPELEEVRKLQELVRRLEIQNQHLRTRSHRNVLGTNTQTNMGVNHHNLGLSGMEINNSINTVTEKQELPIMADVNDKLSKIRTEMKENDCLKKDMDSQMHYSSPSSTEKVSPNSKYMNEAEMQNVVNVSCSSSLDTSSSTELVEDLITIGMHPSIKMNEQNPNEDSGDLGSFLHDTALDEVDVLELGNCSDEEDSWLYVSPRKSTADQKTEPPLKWYRQVLDNPSPETEVACRALINRLDQGVNVSMLPLSSPTQRLLLIRRQKNHTCDDLASCTDRAQLNVWRQIMVESRKESNECDVRRQEHDERRQHTMFRLLGEQTDMLSYVVELMWDRQPEHRPLL